MTCKALAMSAFMLVMKAGVAQEAKKQQSDNTNLDTVQLSKILIHNEDFRKHVLQVALKNTPINWAQDVLRKVPG